MLGEAVSSVQARSRRLQDKKKCQGLRETRKFKAVRESFSICTEGLRRGFGSSSQHSCTNNYRHGQLLICCRGDCMEIMGSLCGWYRRGVAVDPA